VSADSEDRGPAGRARGLWLVALAVLVILVGGGAAVWSLVREFHKTSASLGDSTASGVLPSPSSTRAADATAPTP